jgi:hypothetical protein
MFVGVGRLIGGSSAPLAKIAIRSISVCMDVAIGC